MNDYIQQILDAIEQLIADVGFNTTAWILSEQLDITIQNARNFLHLVGF